MTCAHRGTPTRFLASLLIAAAMLTTCLPIAIGGDWPQLLGPSRNGSATGENLLESWPAAGPQKLRSVSLGQGYAGPVVSGNRVIAFHRVGNQEQLLCCHRDTGKKLWQASFPARYAGGVNPDTGPRCTPVIHAKRVYAFGAAGVMHCVTLDTGKAVWSRDLYGDYRGDEGYFGAGSSPIVADNKLLVNLGGRDNAGLVALALESGKTVWQVTDERASYSSPTVVQVEGKTHVVFVTRLNTICVSADNGKTAFQFPFGRRGPTVNAATPLVFNGHLFVSAAYGVGARLTRIANGTATEVWSNDTSMSSQYSTCVFHRQFLYGTHGREDFNNGELRCIAAQNGRVRWSVPGFGVANVLLAEDRLLALNTTGQLTLAAANSSEYQKLAQASVSRGTTRSVPALAHGLFLFRANTRSKSDLVALVVGKR